MKFTVSVLAVLAIFTVQVVVQAGHSFQKLPVQRAAPGRHSALSARNKGGDGTPKPRRRSCKSRPASSGSPVPSPTASFTASPLASVSEFTTVLTTTSTLTVHAASSPVSVSTTASTMALPTAPSPSSASTVASTKSTTALPSTLSPTPTPPTTSSVPQPSGSGPIDGLVNVISSKGCGPSGATGKITALSGPNGHIDFLTCGINGNGWNPPLIKIEDIVTVDLSAVAYQNGSAFANCQKFVTTFEKYGSQYGIPAIFLASFAMQESSCIPSTVGGAGEQGLMQLTSDKCVGAPNGDCKDVDFNIGAGAMLFSQLLG